MTFTRRPTAFPVSTATALVLSAAWLAAGPAAAQDGVRAGVEVFSPASFASAAPVNAGDMVERLPGFTVVEADPDVRGYAGAQGNVLIDGQRPTSKREDIGDVLDRIPASAVERIELIRSGAPGIDMGGYAVLANVVRRPQAVIEGALTGGVTASTDGWTAPRAEGAFTRRSGERVLDLAFSLEPELDDDTGVGVIQVEEPDGTLDEEADLDTRTIKDKGETTASWRQPLFGGRLSATAAVRGEATRVDTEIEALGLASTRERIDEEEDFREAELGLRYARPLARGWAVESVLTRQQGWLDSEERSREDADVERFAEDTRTNETIARIDLTRTSEALSRAFGVEGAMNVLESDAVLEENGVLVPLPGSDVGIEERRAETSGAFVWKAAPAWRLEAGLRVETSTIRQTGDTPRERSFAYAKPRAAATWDLDAEDQLRLSVSREIGQLDFGDFVASASLETGMVSAGNAELEPDKTWRIIGAWEHRFWDDAAVTVTLTHDEISDVIDRVLVVTPTDVFDAPGNIGDGRRDTLAVDFAVPLDRLGFPGGRIKSLLLWRTSQVTDPVTGQRRPISEEKPFEGEIELTQEAPGQPLRWGVEIEHLGERETKYRFDEIERSSEGTGWTVFVERRIGDRWRLRAEATDLFGRAFEERREKYDGPRSISPVEEIERRRRETPGYVSLTLRRSMGG
jgi:outer membrane receptor protein involved in Fe transport